MLGSARFPQNPNPISLLDIKGEFGGNGALKSYYKGGGNVPSSIAASSGFLGDIPTSGAISIQDFYGTGTFLGLGSAVSSVNNVFLDTGANSQPPVSARWTIGTYTNVEYEIQSPFAGWPGNRASGLRVDVEITSYQGSTTFRHAAVTVANGGEDFLNGIVFNIPASSIPQTGFPPSGVCFTIAVPVPSGAISTINNLSPNGGVNNSWIVARHYDVNSTTNGNGFSLRLDILIMNNYQAVPYIINYGADYAVGDTITILGTAIGTNSSPNLTFDVASLV